MNSYALHVKSSIMIVVIIHKARSVCHGIICLILLISMLIYHIFIGSSSAAKDRP